MAIILADYTTEMEAFTELLQPDSSNRILTFHGKSGTGKTSLVRACIEKIPLSVKHVPLNCKGSAVSVAEVFSRSGIKLNWDRFPTFVNRVAELSGTAQVNVNDNSLTGINNKISVALKAESPVDREERRVALTDAWFEDINTIDDLVLISVDTFEQASQETSEWFSGSFLFRAADIESLRVLIAGQKVPDHHEHASEWGHCCSTFQLVGVKEAKYWMPVIEALGYVVPASDPMNFMAGLCHACHGQPAEIMKLIEGFPRRKNTI